MPGVLQDQTGFRDAVDFLGVHVQMFAQAQESVLNLDHLTGRSRVVDRVLPCLLFRRRHL